ncbi:hypothetical protein BH11MYX1_BH11MYX1_50980 [soil metagenome]
MRLRALASAVNHSDLDIRTGVGSLDDSGRFLAGSQHNVRTQRSLLARARRL